MLSITITLVIGLQSISFRSNFQEQQTQLEKLINTTMDNQLKNRILIQDTHDDIQRLLNHSSLSKP